MTSIRTSPDGTREALLNVLDLFSGCGGFSTGLLQAGRFRVVAACDNDAAAARTYVRNHPATTMVEGDITEERTRRAIRAAFRGKRCDVVVCGLPCQAFSKSKHRDPNDPRARLYVPFFDVVSALMPLAVVIENVPDILTYRLPDRSLVADRITARFRALGYAVGHHVLNAADFGLAQRRRRLFMFAWRQGSIPRPIRTHDARGRGGLPFWRTIHDAIGDLEHTPEDAALSHVFTRHDPEYLARIRNTPIGGKASITYNEGSYRDAPDHPSRTLRGGAWILHYLHDRVITPREAARLQGFGDDFRFEGNKTEVAIQIGNAVPPPLGKAVGVAVLRMLGLPPA